MNLPRCTDPHCYMNGFLLHRNLPWCRKHFLAEGGVM